MKFDEAKLMAARIECDKSLMYFTRLFFKELRGKKFTLNWHHDLIAETLQKVKNYEALFCCVNIPPRHSKTEFAINFIAQGLGENPKGNYLYITSSDELRAESSTRIRDIVSSDLFKSMYGVELKKDQRARNLWRTTEGGGLKTATIFGQITGFGAGEMPSDELIDYIREFEGCIILDDIDKIMDAEKANANNKKTHDTLFNTILSRKNSMDTPIIMIQQRAGEDDSTSVLLEHFNGIDTDKVIHLSLPVIYEGKPLWEAMMDMKTIEGLKTSPRTSHVFETQYMQNPTSPTDKPFHKTKIKYFTSSELPEIKKNREGCLSYIDSKDEGNDYYCHVFGDLIGDTLYITDVIHNKHNTDVNIPKSAQLIKDSGCIHTVIETNAMGSMVFKSIKIKVKSKVVPIPNTANKETRISTNEAFIVNNVRFLSDYESEYAEFMDKLTKYEYGSSGKPDDAPDAMAGLASLTMLKYPHLWK